MDQADVQLCQPLTREKLPGSRTPGGWDAPCDSEDASFYGDLMTERGVMVLMNGMVLDRERSWHRSDAPALDGHELSEPTCVPAGADAATLVHRV